jgi:hypothetical protein
MPPNMARLADIRLVCPLQEWTVHISSGSAEWSRQIIPGAIPDRFGCMNQGMERFRPNRVSGALPQTRECYVFLNVKLEQLHSTTSSHMDLNHIVS